MIPCFAEIMKVSHLVKNLFSEEVEKKAARDGFGEGLAAAGRRDERVVVLCADVTASTRCEAFKKEFPERFVEVGVAEQNLVTLASGMAAAGKIPFAVSYAVFSPGRNWEQIRTTIAYNNQPVKIVGSHVGLTVGPDGATHQALEDMALMRVLPNMVVLAPCDALEAKKAVLAAVEYDGPVYLRLNRNETPIITTEDSPFKIGKAEIFWQGKKPKATIIACGPLVFEVLKAAKELAAGEKSQGLEVEVISCSTIKPLDGAAILKSVKKTGKVVTVEEHQRAGGLGSAAAEFLGENYPAPMKRVGVDDSFGESGEPEELLEKYGLVVGDIIKAVLCLM